MKYFEEGNWFFRSLRFLNLLEPDKAVVSISKVFMWLMVAVTLYVLIQRPEDIAAVLATAGSTLVSVGNYAYRRHIQSKNAIGAPNMEDR